MREAPTKATPSPGESFVAGTQELMGGVRIPMSENVGVRGEMRLRFDDHRGRGTSSNLEQTIGIMIRM